MKTKVLTKLKMMMMNLLNKLNVKDKCVKQVEDACVKQVKDDDDNPWSRMMLTKMMKTHTAQRRTATAIICASCNEYVFVCLCIC